MSDFAAMVRALHEKGVEFIVVGGVAATIHGSARLTEDLDVVYRRTPENLARVVDALQPAQPYLRGAPPGLPFRFDARTLQSGMNFTLTTAWGSIDLLGEITGGGNYDRLLPHTIQVQLFDVPCLCINLRHLVHVKRAAGRPKDLDAIAELESLLEENGGTTPESL